MAQLYRVRVARGAGLYTVLRRAASPSAAVQAARAEGLDAVRAYRQRP